jgi:predicted AAA+ superfamily ATPase
VYRHRVVEDELAALLDASGAVLIEGPKATGKTETASRFAKSSVRLDVDEVSRQAASIDPALVLPGEQPRLIDEWQLVPEIWDHVRRSVDEHPGRRGQFILAGSAVPADTATRHSGAGRFTRLRMRPMSLFESGHSSGTASLRALLNGEEPSGRATHTVETLAIRIAVGGWPALLDLEPAQALRVLRGYLDEVRRTDIQRIDGIRRDPERVMRVLRSIARHTSTEASMSSIAADVGGAEEAVKRQTVAAYRDALARLMIVEDLPAWAPSLRSRTPLRQVEARHFVDPSLAVAALDATPTRITRDLTFLGLLFESLVIRDLRVFAQASDGQVYRYRDHAGLEVDAVVQLRDGTWAAFEVKLGPKMIDVAADNLRNLAERVDSESHGPPACLGVITGWGYAHRRPDGVVVVPIGTLGP